MFYFIIAIIILFDQLTKWLVQSSMTLNTSIPVMEGVFSMTYIHNSGAAFSMLQGKTFLLIGIQLLVIFAMLAYASMKRRGMNRLLLVSLGLIIGGGFGNLIDRVRQGYVVDFFDFHFWPIFNVADIAVSVGCGLLIVYVLFVEGKESDAKSV